MNQELALSIGSKIRETRKNKSISQEQLALLTTIDRSYLGELKGEKSALLLKNSTKYHKH
jgi:transcriptional regulator with XRE-family HTH domain